MCQNFEQEAHRLFDVCFSFSLLIKRVRAALPDYGRCDYHQFIATKKKANVEVEVV